MSSTTRMRAAIVGATGIAGQQFIDALRHHPWFEITVLAASERSAGKSYGDALRDAKSGAVRWWCAEAPPAEVTRLPVVAGSDFDPCSVDVVFSAIESEPARELEPRWAAARPVFSTASAYRYEEDVPLLIPGLGAQGGDLAALKGSGRKAPLLVNVSRGITAANDDLTFGARAEMWKRKIAEALSV